MNNCKHRYLFLRRYYNRVSLARKPKAVFFLSYVFRCTKCEEVVYCPYSAFWWGYNSTNRHLSSNESLKERFTCV